MAEVEKLGKICKQLMLKELRERLKSTDSMLLTTFSELSVVEQERLRQNVKKSRARFYVAKNSMLKRAFDELAMKDLFQLLAGLTGISYAIEDSIATCKALVSFKKEHGNFKLLGGYLEGRPITIAEIETLAYLPSREALLAMAAGAIKAPITGTVFVLSGILRKFLFALKGICDKK